MGELYVPVSKNIRLFKQLRSFVFVVVLLVFSGVSSAQTTVTYTAMTTITCPATPVATISPAVAGLTFSQISRGSGVTCGAAGGSISGAAFNGNLATNLAANKWYTYSITSDATVTFTVSSLKVVSRASNATGANVSVQYSIDAGAKSVIGSFTPTTNPITYTITPGTPIAVGAGQVLNIYIVPNNLTAAGTTCRVENNTSVTVTTSAASGTSITTSSITGSPFCVSASSGTSVSVPYTITGTYDAGNTFTAELSDASGSFASPVNIGSLVSAAAGTIDGTIPAGTAAGTDYRIRVVSDNPATTGANNGANLTINSAATPSISIASDPAGAICSGTSVTFTATAAGLGGGTAAYQWKVNGGNVGTNSLTFSSSTLANGDEVTCSITNITGGCVTATTAVSDAISMTVNTVPAIPFATAGTFVHNSSFKANWDAVPGAIGYYVDVYTNSATDLFISEYLEGSSSNKYIELYNGTGNPVNLGDYRLRLYANGAGTPANDVVLSGTLANGSTIVYKNGSSGIYGGAATTNSAVNFNGNDAIALFKISTNANVDIIGRIGQDPGSAWTAAGGYSTVDKTLVRKSSIASGVTTNPASGFPTLATEWDLYPMDNVAHLGAHVFSGAANYVAGYENVYTTETSLDVSGLSPLTTYYYVVRADNAGCTSVSSNEITVTTLENCATAAMINSFNPASGPAGAMITITGNGFTGATAVKFGTVSATSFTVIDATAIIAEVPANAPTDHIKVTLGCDAVSGTVFSLLDQTGACGIAGGGSTVNDISISEVYDAPSGSLSYIEIFNGTTSPVVLGAPNNYVLRIRTGTSTDNDYALSGTILSGATYVVKLGNGTLCTGVTPDLDLPGASGFNGNDRIYLRKNGSDIDYVPNPNYEDGELLGFGQSRKPVTTAATIPSTTYTASDWVISSIPNCATVKVAPYTINGSSVTIAVHPSDVNCSSVTFTVNSSGAGPGTNAVVWKYNDPATMNGWDNAGNLNGTMGLTTAGTNSTTMTITGNIAQILNYQVYAEIQRGSCVVASNAAQYSYDTKAVYRSNASGGNWSDPGIWQMSDNSTGPWVAVCNYPTAANCNEVIIQADQHIILDIDNKVDKLEIEPTAVLTATANAALDIANGGTGADFIINGTYIDSANTGNSLGFATGASWVMSTGATLVKANNSSAAVYRDNYEQGISNIPLDAHWIVRGSSTTDASFTTATGSTGSFPSASYYPNLSFESSNGVWNPVLSTSRFSGSASTATIKGHLDIGGNGAGTVTIYNENTAALPLRVSGNLVVRAGSILTNDGNTAGTGFDVAGNIISNGAIRLTAGSGSLKLSGNIGTQDISGTGEIKLQHLTVANFTSVITLNRDIDMIGTLRFNALSRLDLETGNIVLKSTAAKTAAVAVVPANATINYPLSGRFIVERFISAGRKWRFLAVPTDNDQTVKDAWQEGAANVNDNPVPGYGMQVTDVAGTWLTNGFDAFSPGGPSVKVWDPGTEGYKGITSTNIPIENIYGYMVFVRGNRLDKASNASSDTTVLRTKGKLLTGTQAPITVPKGKFQSVGNPYASAIDLRTISSSDLSTEFYLWDPKLGGSYGLGAFQTLTRSGGPGTDYFVAPGGGSYPAGIGATYNFAQSGQAFFVKALNNINDGMLVFGEANKVAVSDPVFFVPGAPELLRANLFQVSSAEPVLLDGVLALFDANNNNEYDGNDGLKLPNGSENIGLLRSNNLLAVERRNYVTGNDTLFINFSGARVQDYKWALSLQNMDAPGRSAFLADRFLHTTTVLDPAGTTEYTFSVIGNAASKATDRFYIFFKQSGVLPVRLTQIAATRNRDNSVTVNWKSENELNLQQYKLERSMDGRSFSGIATKTPTANNGASAEYDYNDLLAPLTTIYYRVKATGIDGHVYYSATVKVASPDQIPVLSVYPNPVTDQQLQVKFTNQPEGLYSLQLTNKAGQLVHTATAAVTGNNFVKTVTLDKTVAAGNYQLVVMSADGKRSVIMVVIK